MPIFKTEIEVLASTGNFSIITNVPFADPNLSFKAKGVLIYLLTKKESWIIQIQDLENNSTNGRDSIYAALRELREAGYAQIKTERKDGRIFRKYWSITDTPDPSLKRVFSIKETLFKKTQTISKNGIVSKNKNSAALPTAGSEGFGLVAKSVREHHPMAPILAKKFLEEFVIPRNLHVGTSWWSSRVDDKGKKKRLNTKNKWISNADDLISKVEGNTKKIIEVMNWYFQNYGRGYLPVVHTLTTFLERYDAIVVAMSKLKDEPVHKKIIVEREDSSPEDWGSPLEQELQEHEQAVKDGRKRRGL